MLLTHEVHHSVPTTFYSRYAIPLKVKVVSQWENKIRSDPVYHKKYRKAHCVIEVKRILMCFVHTCFDIALASYTMSRVRLHNHIWVSSCIPSLQMTFKFALCSPIQLLGSPFTNSSIYASEQSFLLMNIHGFILIPTASRNFTRTTKKCCFLKYFTRAK